MSDKENDDAVSTDLAEGESTSPLGSSATGGDAEASESSARLTELMSTGAAAAGEAKKPDLDADAMRAAQAAIAEGERALASARAQLGKEQEPARKRSKGRELALRLLLAANVLAMFVIMSLPAGPAPTDNVRPDSAADPVVQPSRSEPVQAPSPPPPVGPRLADKYNQALLASESRNYGKAVELLEEYLAETPRMPASRLVNVYRAMAHYSSAIGHFRESQDYERRAQAVTQSHSLPEDLVAMANAAAESGDQESLRQVWARFLLQQRQIPSSLYQHVAEAYLQLGDSYRIQANDAAERARLDELQRVEELLRKQGSTGGQKR